MKEEILSIASDLREGFITSNEAQKQLLRLFGVVRPESASVLEGELLQGEAVAKSVSGGKVIDMHKRNEQELYKRILKRGEPGA